MTRRRQFSLGYLFLETLWVGLALAASRAALAEWAIETAKPRTSALAFFTALAAWLWCIAIGGAVGRMTGGAAIGFLVFWTVALVLSCFF